MTNDTLRQIPGRLIADVVKQQRLYGIQSAEFFTTVWVSIMRLGNESDGASTTELGRPNR